MKKNNIDKEFLCTNDFVTQINFLCSSKLSKQNNKIITEYFFDKFTNSPEDFNRFIYFLKEYIISLPQIDKEKLAVRYLDILSFLCERFGLYEDKLILDDMCFHIINPEEYNNISLLLSKYKENSKEIIKKIYGIFEEKLKEYKIKATIKGRYKNIYSIYKKCKKKNDMNALKLSDIFAFRIIVKGNPDKCFDVLNILHNTFYPLPDRFKDYISIPKINGYQSIHTGLINVIPDLDLIIEVQIRNEIMNEIAEQGIAAHFLYSRNKKSTLENSENRLFQYFTHSNNNKLDKLVYCLTPNGDIIKLYKGNTIIDFANKIHSELGKKAKHAIINGKNKKLSHKVKNYEMIKIIK